MLQERLARLPPQPGLEHPAVIGERDALLLLPREAGLPRQSLAVGFERIWIAEKLPNLSSSSAYIPTSGLPVELLPEYHKSSPS